MSTECVSLELETEIPKALAAAGLRAANVGSRPEALVFPSADVAVTSGNFKISGRKLIQEHEIIVLIVVKNLNDREKHRRAQMHPLVQAVVVVLHGQKFGLPIQPLVAGPWRETTSIEFLQKGLMQVEIKFSTESEAPLPREEDAAADLLEILSSFHLVQADGTLTTDPVAQDDVKRDA